MENLGSALDSAFVKPKSFFSTLCRTEGFQDQMKVSGCFKSIAGAQRFALLHSVADTARKNGRSPLHVFQVAPYW